MFRVAALALLLLLPAWSAAAGTCAAPGEPAPVARIKVPDGVQVGVALGSGSVHGLAHIGVLEQLEAGGVDVPVVAGTSVGALIGSLWASGIGAREIAALSRVRHWEDVGRMSGSFEGFFTNDDLKAELEPLFKGRPIESWPRRFGAVATNLANGHRRVLMSGDAALAVQASTAIPLFYAPVTIDGERLGDGALVEPLPVEAARDLGANFVIAVDVGYRPYESPASGLFDNGFQAMHILINALADRQARDADFVIHLDLHEEMTRCGKTALVRAGREAMGRAWPLLAAAIRKRAIELAHNSR